MSLSQKPRRDIPSATLHPVQVTERPSVFRCVPFDDIPKRAKEGTRPESPSATHLDAASTNSERRTVPAFHTSPPLTYHSRGSDGASLRSHRDPAIAPRSSSPRLFCPPTHDRNSGGGATKSYSIEDGTRPTHGHRVSCLPTTDNSGKAMERSALGPSRSSTPSRS